MCLFAKSSCPRQAALQQCSRYPLHHHLVEPRPITGRRPVQIHAVAVQERAPQEVRDSMPMQAGSAGSQLPPSIAVRPVVMVSSSAQQPVHQPKQQQPTVEVHFQIEYACDFGQHLSIIGSPQGWHVPAAVPMTWSQDNLWRAVLPVHVGTEVDYKYIVVWNDGMVARWQEGPNNRLSAQHPGALLHVEDTWGQGERLVREVGLRLTHNPQHTHSGGHSSSATTAPKAPAGAGAGGVSLPANWTNSTPGSSSDSENSPGPPGSARTAMPASSSAAAMVVPPHPTWNVMFDQQQPLMFGQMDMAAADEDDLLQYEDEEEDQHWPAEMLQRAAAAAAQAATAAAPPAATPGLQHPNTPAAAAAAAVPPAAVSVAAPSRVTPVSGQMPKDVPPVPPVPPVTPQANINSTSKPQRAAAVDYIPELLPLLRAELAAALAELAQHPEAASDQAALLSEGQAVLAALQAHDAPLTASSTASSSTPSSPAQASTGGSSSGSRSSPARSPGSTLASGDEIAAALLSDDCEEACFCMVDAICSCADWDLSCSCEDDLDTPCTIHDDHDSSDSTGRAVWKSSSQQLRASEAAAAAPAVTSWASAPADAVQEPLMVPPTTTPAAADSSGSLSIAELARAAAIAARYDPAALAARAAAFTDVHSALERSSQLLQALTDPSHPMILEADRQLATASRRLHSGHLLH